MIAGYLGTRKVDFTHYKVYNLTPLILSNSGSHLIRPILQNAGNDISHWFDKEGLYY
jgi:hypothetical protein